MQPNFHELVMIECRLELRDDPIAQAGLPDMDDGA